MLFIHFIHFFLVAMEVTNLVYCRPALSRNQVNLNKNIVNKTMANRPIKRLSRKGSNLKENSRNKDVRILNIRNRRGAKRLQDLSDQDIIFPDSMEDYFEPIPRIDDTPKCADGSTFCENYEEYPHQHLKEVLSKHHISKDFFFGEDETPVELESRMGDDKETFVCGSVSRIVFPKIGINKNNEWKYIVNQGRDDGYVQGVRIETCTQENGPCAILGELPNGYTTSCKQKYIYRRLLSLNEDGKPIPDTFQLPSACCCSYKIDLSFLARFGKSTIPIK